MTQNHFLQFPPGAEAELRTRFAAVAQREMLGAAAAEALYALAYQQVGQGQFEQAADLLLVLTALRPLDARFWLGLGVCAQQGKRYTEAIGHYGTAALLDPDPAIGLKMVECELLAGLGEQARLGLDSLIDFCAAGPHLQAVGERAQAMRRMLDRGAD